MSTWLEYTDFESARIVTRQSCLDIADVRGQTAGGWNAGGHGNRLLLALRSDAARLEVTPATSGRVSVAVDGYVTEVFGHAAPSWLNVHFLGDLFYHRLVAGTSREKVRERIEAVYATSALPTGPISSNFLGQTLLGRQPFMTLNLPAYSAQDQQTAFARIATNGYRDVDLYAMNVGPPGDNPFGGPWRIDAYQNPNQVIDSCRMAHAAGLRVTLWLWSDDMRGVPMREAIRRQDVFLPKLVQPTSSSWPHVDRIVYALEGDEARGTSGDSSDPDAWTAHNICADPDNDTEFRREGLAYRAKQHMPPGMQGFVHWRDYEIMGNSWPSVDGLYYQARGDTPSTITEEIQRARAKWGSKPVVYAEGPPRNSHSQSRVLAAAALAAGADGSSHG